MLTLGAASFFAGLALLGLGIYSLQGSSDSIAGPAVVDVSSVLRTATPVPQTAAPTPPPVPPLGDLPFRMVIDKLGVDAPVSVYGLDANAVPEVPTGPDAKDIVVWYNFSSQPGTGSNAVFAGHVTWNGRAVFYELTSLAAGDLVKLRGADGTELAYKISSVFSVDPNNPDSLSVMRATDHDAITIITCDGTFVHTGDPVFGGEYSNRLVVRADLMSITHSGAAPAAGG